MTLNKLIILGTSLVLGATVLPAVNAQDDTPQFQPGGPAAEGRRHRGGPARQRPGGNPEILVERLDADSDGFVDEDEFLDARLARLDREFERRDMDGDGLLSEEEASRPARRGPRGARGARGDSTEREEVIACVRETIADWEGPHEVEDRFDAVDTDLDGYISLVELSTALQERAYVLFDRIDTDNDGLISLAEVEAHQDSELNLRRVIRACVDQVTDPFEASL